MWRIELGLFSQVCHVTIAIRHVDLLPNKGTVGGGNASQIRVYHSEEYYTVPNYTEQCGWNSAYCYPNKSGKRNYRELNVALGRKEKSSSGVNVSFVL